MSYEVTAEQMLQACATAAFIGGALGATLAAVLIYILRRR